MIRCRCPGLPGGALMVLLSIATSAHAQTPIEHTLAPGRTYDPAIPAPTRSLGYSLGQDIATYAQMVPYFEKLAASSRRVRLGTHGQSYEGRPIYDVTISTPENLARIDQIRANLAKLADPRKLSGPQELESIVTTTPAVVLLVFGTDGAETAGPEAAIQVAYQLAAGTDARTQSMLRSAIVVIVPAENPDANQRAVAWYNAFRVGASGTGDPDAAEHQFPWGINSNNHYQIDPNRESVWGNLRESQAMIALYRQWNPQVYVDNHGEYAVYTGPWYVEPLHDVLTARQREWHHTFGQALQAEFAKRGYAYHPWEFGQFDPGYWDTYPNFSGTIAWTTETTGGGSRGLRLDRREAPSFTLADGAIQHVIAADVTIALAGQNRERLLRDFHAYKSSALEEGASGAVKAYAISAHNDPRSLAAVVNTMRRNAIEVQRTTRELPLTGARPYFRTTAPARLPAGSYIISTAQPESRMLRVLMEPEAKFSPDFLAQIAKAQADTTRSPGRLFYDITAWSLPYSYNLDAYELTEAVPPTGLTRVTEDVVLRGEVMRPAGAQGFVIDYSSNTALGAIARLRRESIPFRVAPASFTAGGRTFAAGSAVLLRADNPARDLAALARTLAQRTGATVVGIDNAETSSALKLDTTLARAKTGRIAVLMDRPVSPTSYGHVWFTFEQVYGVDFTALNFDRLITVNLDKYSTIIVPDGNYGSVNRGIASDIAAKLRSWVERGGTLVGMRGGSAWIAAPETGITTTRMRRPAVPRLPAIPGAIFRAVVEPNNPLTFGYSDEVPVMVWSALAFDPGVGAESPVKIATADRARVSGFVFPESMTHVAGSPYVVRERRGQGNVVLFLDDPNFRLFWDGLTRIFFNAVFL